MDGKELIPPSSLAKSEDSAYMASAVKVVVLPPSTLSCDSALTMDPEDPTSLVPAVMVVSVNSVAVAEVSSEMSPMIPVRSHGQNSPAFQSRHAEHRAQG